MLGSTITVRVLARWAASCAMAAGLMIAMPACSSPTSDARSGGGISVPLQYRPTNMAEGARVPAGKPKVFLAMVEDTRTRTNTIGENREESTPIPVRSGSGSPAQFVHEALRTELTRHGVNVVETTTGADRTVATSITTFEANETNTYDGQILLIVKVLDASGKVLAERSASGENTTWGKSAQPENYQQVLSNAMVDLFSRLMGNADFVKALSMAEANPS